MKNFTLTISLFCLILSFPSTTWAGRNIAIIIDGSDPHQEGIGPLLTKISNNMANLMQGKEVIRINAANGATAKDIIKTISELKDVEHLEISFLTHGVVRNPDVPFEEGKPLSSIEKKERMPLSHLRPDEVLTQYTSEKAKIDKAVRFSFAMLKPEEINANKDFLGLGELHDALAKLKAENPKLKTNLTILSCYGGNAIRALKDIPDLQVFTSSSGGQVAIMYGQPNLANLKKARSTEMDAKTSFDCKLSLCTNVEDGVNYPILLQTELSTGKNYLDSHLVAKTKSLAEKLDVTDLFGKRQDTNKKRGLFSIPQSSLETAFADACLGAPSDFEVEQCEQPQKKQAYGDLSADVTSTLLFEYLSKLHKAEKSYYETLKRTHSCGYFSKSQDSKTLKDAIEMALTQTRRFAENFSQNDLDKNIEDLKAILQNVKEAKTVDTVVEMIGRTTLLQENSSFQSDFLRLKDTKAGVESYKSMMTDALEEKLKSSQAPNALKNMRETLSIDFKLWGDAKKNPFVIRDPHYLNLVPHSEILLKQPTNMFNRMDSTIFLVDKCPKSKFFESNSLNGEDISQLQIKCIKEESKNDPWLGLFALAQIAYDTAEDDERKNTCELFDTAIEYNKKIGSCLSKGSVKDENALRKMQALFIQGMDKR